MPRRRLFGALIFAIPAVLALATFAVAGDDGSRRNFRAGMIGYEEVPAISTLASGSFEADLDGAALHYRLTYSALQGTVQQAHIHFGQRSVNGGIVVFLCSNLGNGPAGTQACPAQATQGAPVEGTIVAADVGAGAVAQAIAAGEFDELVRALRAGVAYANVHSSLFPGGEIRGQLNDRGRGDNDRNNDDEDD